MCCPEASKFLARSGIYSRAWSGFFPGYSPTVQCLGVAAPSGHRMLTSFLLFLLIGSDALVDRNVVRDCAGADLDRAVTACSRIIEMMPHSEQQVAVAYFCLGRAEYIKHQGPAGNRGLRQGACNKPAVRGGIERTRQCLPRTQPRRSRHRRLLPSDLDHSEQRRLSLQLRKRLLAWPTARPSGCSV